MNLDYSEEQKLLKESIERWAQDNYSFDQRNASADNEVGFSDEHWNTFAELGWLSIPFAEADGGFGGNIVDMAAIMEEFGKALLLEPMFTTMAMFGGVVSAAGSEQQRADLLEPLIGGQLKGAVGVYEPHSRFDMSDVQTKASESGDGYAISGSKSMVLGAPSADKIVVLARTSGEAKDEAGLSLFLVDADAAGLSRHDYSLMDGHKASDLTLNDVTGELMGELDAAYATMSSVMEQVHIALAAEAVGIMEVLNKTTVEYTKKRK
ncbi:MAG: acyl-CoA dehydrogenase family protein, partial [Pseudomonadota bacterium]